MCRILPTLSYFYFFLNKRFTRASNALGNTFRHVAKASNLSGNNFRHARKCQTTRETTFAMRGNVKPFGKRLSPCAEMPNPSGNDFRHARKCQTFREMTFAMWRMSRFFNILLFKCSRSCQQDFKYQLLYWRVSTASQQNYLKGTAIQPYSLEK